MATIKHDTITEGILVVKGVERQIHFSDGYVDLPYEIALKVVNENPSWKFASRPEPTEESEEPPTEEAPRQEVPRLVRRRGGRV